MLEKINGLFCLEGKPYTGTAFVKWSGSSTTKWFLNEEDAQKAWTSYEEARTTKEEFVNGIPNW